MLWRHLCLVRAWSAAGLVSGIIILGASSATAQTASAVDLENSAPPAEVQTENVDLLKASKLGELEVVAHGQGQDRVRLSVRNRSGKRLNVVVPPGMVAASATAQGRGLQSMGLGSVNNRPGSFGQFRNIAPQVGLQSVPVSAPASISGVAVPPGESIDLTVPAVCLNFGLPSPTPRDTFTLMDVEDYSSDVRVRKSLRSLALMGTSQAVAQSVMWRVCNNVPFETMASQAGKVMNEHEIALAARFVEALDASSGLELVDPSYLSEGRVFVRIQGEGALAGEARRLNDHFEGVRLMGLPVRVLDSGEMPAAEGPAMMVKVTLTDTKIGQTRGRVSVSYCSQTDQWSPLGKANFEDSSSVAVLDGATLARALDRSLASAFVTVKPARRVQGATTLKVENHLPFTLSAVHVRAGSSAGGPSVPFEAVGVGPARSALLPIQAATATVDHIELNGL